VGTHPGEAAMMSEEIRKRAVRVIANIGMLLLIVAITSFAMPGVLAVIGQIPRVGLTIGSAVGLLLVFIAAFFSLRTLLDLIRLVDLVSNFVVSRIPGLRIQRRVSIIRALKELIVVLALIVGVSLISPFLVLIPDFGFQLQLAISIGFAVPSIILLYDAGKTLYAVFQSMIEFIIERLPDGSARQQQDKTDKLWTEDDERSQH
jgi:hypothetical protein